MTKEKIAKYTKEIKQLSFDDITFFLAAIAEMNNHKNSRKKIITAMEILHTHPLFSKFVLEFYLKGNTGKFRSVSLIADNPHLKDYSALRLWRKIFGSANYVTSNDFSKDSKLRIQFVNNMGIIRSTYFKVMSYGILAVSLTKDGKPLDKYLLNFVRLYLDLVLAPVVDLAIDNERNFKAAIHDALTGVYNKGYLTLQLKKECANIREKGTLSLLMIDLDNFKTLNDTYGHPIGDKVLKAVAKLLHDGVREFDTVGRFGGEEFVVLLPDSDIETAKKRAEALRKIIYEFDYGVKEFKDNYRVSISVGVGNIPYNSSNETGLMDVADKAVYISKTTGKNKVSVFGNQ